MQFIRTFLYGEMAAAEPVQASTLWSAYQSDRPFKSKRLSCGLPSINDALGGGLDYGCISCLTAGLSDVGASDLKLAWLVEHLLSEQNATAAFVDTTLAFDVRKMHTLLLKVLQERSRNETDAFQALDRLKIMKVFDFVGLTESVAEVQEGLEERDREAILGPKERVVHQKCTIDDNDEDDEDEMLDSPLPLLLQPQAQPTKSSPLSHYDPNQHGRSPGLLIIDNIAHVTTPMLKTSFAQGQILLTSFMHSLSRLARMHNLCVLLINNTTNYNPAQQHGSKEEPPSIFASCPLRPALGKIFSHLLDLHLLTHTLPKTADDARIAYSLGYRDVAGRKADWGHIVEVLQDRYDGRVGSWAAFDVGTDGRLRDIA